MKARKPNRLVSWWRRRYRCPRGEHRRMTLHAWPYPESVVCADCWTTLECSDCKHAAGHHVLGASGACNARTPEHLVCGCTALGETDEARRAMAKLVEA